METAICRNGQFKILNYTHQSIYVNNGVQEGYFHEEHSVKSPLKRLYSTSVVQKMLATQIVAELLGLSDLIPPSRWVSLRLPNEMDKVGLLMIPARGYCVMELQDRRTRKEKITPQFQRQLNNLHLMDIVCGEKDHHACNYNVVPDEKGMFVSLEAFDNSGGGTFSFRADVTFRDFKQCSPYINKDGTVNRPYVDGELIDRLTFLSWQSFYSALRKTLPFICIVSVWIRFKKVLRAVKKTARLNPGFLVRSDEWSSDTIQEELSGSYGKTYLCSMINDYIL